MLLSSQASVYILLCFKYASFIEFKSRELINLVEDISRQPITHSMSWLFLDAFSFVYKRIGWKKKEKKFEFKVEYNESVSKKPSAIKKIFQAIAVNRKVAWEDFRRWNNSTNGNLQCVNLKTHLKKLPEKKMLLGALLEKSPLDVRQGFSWWVGKAR